MATESKAQQLYREYIENLKRFWVGKKVIYAGEQHTVVGIDYNGALLIDRPTQWNETTSVAAFQLDDYDQQIS